MISANDLYNAEIKRGAVFSLLLVVAVFAVYANSLGNGLVWDDTVVILKNPALRDVPFSLLSGIDSGRDVELTPYYRPLTLFTFFVEERLHGFTPYLMHLLNVLLHAVNAFLVHRLTRVVTGNNHAAVLAGLLFAVHPINSEAVNFISGGRNTLLSGLFVLMAYLLHRRSIVVKRAYWALAGAVFFLAGLYSKETALAILPFIMALEIPLLRSYAPGQRFKAVRKLAPYGVFTVVYFIMRKTALFDAGVSVEILPGLGARLLDNVFIIPRYLLTVVWPPSLSIRYYIPDDLHLLALPLIISWCCIICSLGWFLTRGRSPGTLFGLSWLIVFWLPVSGIISIPSAPMADRYLYVPAIGLWIVVADQFIRLFHSEIRVRRDSAVAAVFVLLVLTAFTVSRNREWKDDVTLFSRYVKQFPEQAFGHHNLGCAYLDKVGDLEAAEREFEKTLALDPQFPRLRTQMGYINLLRGDYAGAVNHYNEAIAQNPFDAEAYLNRAMASDRLGRYEDAVTDYKYFLSIPGNELAGARVKAAERVRELSE